MSKFYPKIIVALFAMLFACSAFAQVSVTATAGTTGPTVYTTLKLAFDAINAGTHQGAITISITASTTETATALLSASGTTGSSYTSVLIKPAASATPTITGAVATTLIDLNGADNVTIDGSNTAGGTTKDLTISNTGTSNTLRIINGATTNTIKNSIIKGAVTNSGVIVIAGSTAPAGNDNNIIQNNDITKSGAGPYAIGIFATGTSGKPNTGNIYRGNKITEFSLIGISEGYTAAGVAGYSNNTLIEGNEIYQLTSRTTAITGIRVDHPTGITNITISKNYIHDMLTSYVAAAPPVSYVTGIDIYDAGSATVVNNMIIMDVPTSQVLNGIAVQTAAGANIKVYYNTVVIRGTTSGTNVSYAFLKNWTSTGDDVKNNIFLNTRTSSGAGDQASIGHFSTGSMASNYNDLYSSGNASNIVAVNSAGDYATLAAWQAASGYDANSVSVLPVFVSTTNLHLVAASNSGLDSKGIAVSGVTTDYDNETRSVTPDIGADEMPASADVNGPTIAYTPLTSTCSGADRTLTATINDATGVPVSGTTVPRIYYRKTGGVWYSQPGQLTAGNGTSGTWSFTINNADMGGVTNGNTIEYYVIAQDLVATPNISSSPSGVTASNVNTVTSHPSSPATYMFGALMSGTFTVGSGGTYPTLTSAINAYNQACLNGPVTFSLISSTYGAGETFPLVIGNSGASATNTLTIKPAAGVSPVISSAAISDAVIKLNGADYVTIDGSNTAGGTTRNLTISTLAANAHIWISSENASNGATNNTIKNVIMTGATDYSTIAGIISGGGAFGEEAVSPNSNNSAINNSISRVQNGMYIRGNSTTFDANWVVAGNDIGSAVTADKVLYRGILIGNAQNFAVTSNRIIGINTGTTHIHSPSGIQLAFAHNGGTISNNVIRDIRQLNSTTGYNVNGILLGSSSTAAGVSVFNNFISEVSSFGSATTGNGYGINVSAGGGYNIDYNTVLMNTNQTLTGGKPAAFNVMSTVTTAVAINLRNNLFINTQTVGTERYAIYSAAPNSVFGTINFNDYYTTGPNLGFIGSNRADLAAIQAGFGGNTNSVSALPVFVSATDLHLNPTGNTAIEDKGTAIAGITVDIDNQTRSATPDLGADEILTCLLPSTPGTITGSATVCSGAGAQNYSIAAVANATSYVWTAPAGWTITGGQGTTAITVTPGAAGQNGNLTVAATNGCGSSPTSSLAVTSNGTPAVPGTITGSAGQCSGASGQTYSITAVPSATTYTWSVPTGWAITGGQGTTSVTVTAGTTGQNGNITVTAGNGCGTSAAATLAVTVVSSASITTQPTAQSACTGQAATFSVTASGSNLTYQWRKAGVNITGATSSSYIINNVTAADAANYDVVINSSCGAAVTSNSVALTVTQSAAITTHPVSQSVCTGANVTFSVTATGTSLTYQWRKNGTNITGATNATYTLNGVTAADAADYSVVVGSACGPVTSNNATLTIGAGSVWTGTTSNDWNNAANWCNGVPTATSDVTINSGAPNQPTINATANVRNLTLATGVTLSITASGRLNIHGDYVNNGTLSAGSGTVAFQGAAMQNVAALTAGTIIINGGGVTLTGNMTAGTTLTLTAGNIITGNNTVTLNSSTTGSTASHIVTNGLGIVTVNNVNNAVTVPVGPDAASYNPVIISNGQGRNYTVKVATGITPSIANNARGINRTWTVVPNTAPANPVTITLQYADADANASATGSAAMDIGVHSGTAWYMVSQPGGVMPTGTATNRQVTVQTLAFGPMAVGNVGAIGTLTSLPAIDADITSAVLMPNIFESNTILRLHVKRSMKIDWMIMDAQGRVVMTFSRQAMAGQNDISLMLRHLSNGTYYLRGQSDKGSTEVLRLIRL